MTSWLQGAGITHALGRTTQAEETVTEAFTVRRSVLGEQRGNLSLGLSLTASETKRSLGSIYWTCLSTLVADRALEAWYHPSIA